MRQDGRPCGATRRRDVPFCFVHDPDASEEVELARRRGGERRRHEQVVAVALEITGISTVAEISRLLEVVMIETLRLANDVPRNRALMDLARVAIGLLAVAETEDRLARLEAAVLGAASRSIAYERGLADVAAHRAARPSSPRQGHATPPDTAEFEL